MVWPSTVTWANPELSVGRKIIVIKRKTVWEATGPALERFENELSKSIINLLHTHKEQLESKDEFRRTVSFNLWMVGKECTTAVPTVIFTSRSAPLREAVVKLIKEHNILADFLGFKLKSMDRQPAIPMGFDINGSDANLGEYFSDERSVIYARGSLHDVCGAVVSVGGTYDTTLGGVLVIGGEYYGFIALHGGEDMAEDSESIICREDDLKFDDDESDITSIMSSARPSLRRLNSQRKPGSLWKYSSGRSSRPESLISTHSKALILSHRMSSSTLDFESRRRSSGHNSIAENKSEEIGTLIRLSVGNGLDYGIFLIKDFRYRMSNRVTLPVEVGKLQQYLFPENIATVVQEANVWVACGISGVLKGVIVGNPYFIKMAGSENYQKMWPVDLDRDMVAGDCGAWVIDAESGNLYGHIVAGDSFLHRAYVVQITDVINDIQTKMHESVHLPNLKGSEAESAMMPQDYADSVSYFADQPTFGSVYPGVSFMPLAKFLQQLGPEPREESGSSGSPPQAFVNARSKVTGQVPRLDEGPHVILYNFQPNGQISLAYMQDIHDSLQTPDTGKPQTTGALLFLRGYPSPHWLNVIGAKYRVDPQFFLSHMSFLCDKDYFHYPALPSSTGHMVHLRFTTIGEAHPYENAKSSGRYNARRDDSKARMKSYLERLRTGSGISPGDSIIRSFLIHNERFFTIEQDISIWVDKTAEGWTALVWLDVGNSLEKGAPGPWMFEVGLPRSTSVSLYPTPQYRSKMTFAAGARKRIPGGNVRQHRDFRQTAARIHENYGIMLNPKIMAKDPIYALQDVFKFFTASEAQFLNMMEKQIRFSVTQVDSMLQETSILQDLMMNKDVLGKHILNLQDSIRFLQNQSTLAQEHGLEDFHHHSSRASEELLDDHKYLLERLRFLSDLSDSTINVMMNLAAIRDSKTSVDQSRQIRIFTITSIIFLPLGFASSLFGMNFNHINYGPAVWGTLSASLFFAAFVLYFVYTYSSPGSMKRSTLHDITRKTCPKPGPTSNLNLV